MSGNHPSPLRIALRNSDLAPEASAPAETFTAAFRNHAAGVAVITADPGGSPVAMTVSSLSSVSVDPPLLVFSASERSTSTPVLERSDTVLVHMLSTEQLELARLCATSGVDRFADTAAWSPLPTGEPRFHNASAWLRGTVALRVALSGSVLYVVHVTEASLNPEQHGAPLAYHNRAWHRLGEHSALG